MIDLQYVIQQILINTSQKYDNFRETLHLSNFCGADNSNDFVRNQLQLVSIGNCIINVARCKILTSNPSFLVSAQMTLNP